MDKKIIVGLIAAIIIVAGAAAYFSSQEVPSFNHYKYL